MWKTIKKEKKIERLETPERLKRALKLPIYLLGNLKINKTTPLIKCCTFMNQNAHVFYEIVRTMQSKKPIIPKTCNIITIKSSKPSNSMQLLGKKKCSYYQ